MMEVINNLEPVRTSDNKEHRLSGLIDETSAK